METHFVNAALKRHHSLHINLNDIVFRDDRGIPFGDDQPPCDPDVPESGSDQPPISQGDPEPTDYADIGGDEVKDDYPEAPPSGGEPPQGYIATNY